MLAREDARVRQLRSPLECTPPLSNNADCVVLVDCCPSAVDHFGEPVSVWWLPLCIGGLLLRVGVRVFFLMGIFVHQGVPSTCVDDQILRKIPCSQSAQPTQLFTEHVLFCLFGSQWSAKKHKVVAMQKISAFFVCAADVSSGELEFDDALTSYE